MAGKGNPKGVGRPKGIPNKNSLKFSERLEELNLNLIDDLVKTLPLLSPEDKARTLLGMLRYAYPTLKSIEMQLDNPGALVLTPENVALMCDIARKSSLEAAKNRD